MKELFHWLDQFKRLLIEITCIVLLGLTIYQIIKTKLDHVLRDDHPRQLNTKKAVPSSGRALGDRSLRLN